MNFFSTFSGIEAASVAWEPLGFKAIGFSEVAEFPSAVLAQRFPKIKNYGNIENFKEWGIEPGSAKILIGGSPCQAFSVGGYRRGIQDHRGSLALTFAAFADYLRPDFILWENVPGVLNSNGGRDFSCFLQSMEELGFVGGWRVFDSQNFGVRQRRRRIYGLFSSSRSVGDVAKVLFDKSSSEIPFEEREGQKENQSRTSSTFVDQGRRIYGANGFGSFKEGVATLRFRGGDVGGGSENIVVESDGRVRRTTPVEAERFQGFPDNFTRIAWKGKAEEDCPDSLRYAALGNSMSVPVIRWIGQRIKSLEEGNLE